MSTDDRTPEPAREEDVCEHGVSFDADCSGCDALGRLYESFGAVTPNEHGIAHRAYKAGLTSAPIPEPVVQGEGETPRG